MLHAICEYVCYMVFLFLNLNTYYSSHASDFKQRKILLKLSSNVDNQISVKY